MTIIFNVLPTVAVLNTTTTLHTLSTFKQLAAAIVALFFAYNLYRNVWLRPNCNMCSSFETNCQSPYSVKCVSFAEYDTIRCIQPHANHPYTREVGLVLQTRRIVFRLQLHFDESMLSIERLSHLFVATVSCNATEFANYTLSICTLWRGTKKIPLSEAARQAKNVHDSEALHCLC